MFVGSSRLLAKYNLPSVVTLQNPLSQALQNHAAKTVLQADYFSSSSYCLDRLHWLPVSQKCKFKLLWLIACTLKLEQPAYLFDLLSIRHTRQPLRFLHSGLQLHQSVFSDLFTSRSFSHQAPPLWNPLSSNLRSSPSHELSQTFENSLIP